MDKSKGSYELLARCVPVDARGGAGEVAADEARGYRLRACSMRDVTCGSPISAVFTCPELHR